MLGVDPDYSFGYGDESGGSEAFSSDYFSYGTSSESGASGDGSGNFWDNLLKSATSFFQAKAAGEEDQARKIEEATKAYAGGTVYSTLTAQKNPYSYTTEYRNPLPPSSGTGLMAQGFLGLPWIAWLLLGGAVLFVLIFAVR
jgi:hypothetical protein